MDRHSGYFVDLFVRTTNRVAIGMYEQFGYSVYRRVKGYYHGGTGGKKHEDEDAFGLVTLGTFADDRYEETFKAG